MPKHRKHRPPSQVRYDKTHPIISFRLDLKTKQRLKKVLEKQSVASFIKEALGVREREKESLESAHENGHVEGANHAMKRCGIYVECTVCGEEMLITSEEWKKEIGRYLRNRGIRHVWC